MDFSINADFNQNAAPTPDLIRRLGRRAWIEASSIAATARQRADERRDQEHSDDLFMALSEITAAVYRETQQRLLTMLEIDIEASHLALLEIEQLLAKNEAERQAMIDRAVKLEDGTAVFLTEDESAIYTEHGDQVSDDAFRTLLEAFGKDLRSKPRWDTVLGKEEDRAALLFEQNAIQQHIERAAEVETAIAGNTFTLDEMEVLEADYQASTPDRVLGLKPVAEAELVRRDASFESQAGQSAMPPTVNDPSDQAPPEASPTLGTSPPAVRRPSVSGPAP